MAKLLSFPEGASAKRGDEIEYEMIGILRSIEALDLANDGEDRDALRAYHLEHLTGHYRKLDELLFPASR